MPVPNTMSDLAPVAGDNYPVGSEPIGNNLDNYLRAHAALIRQGNAVASSSMPSGSTVNVANANGESVLITGSSTINSLGTGFVGCKRELRFSGSPTLTHSSNLQLPGNADISAEPGMVLKFRCIANNTWVYAGGTYTPPMSADEITSGTLPVERGGTGASSWEPLSFLQVALTGTTFLARSPTQVRTQIGAAASSQPVVQGALEVRSSTNDGRRVVLTEASGEVWGGMAAAGNMSFFSDGRNIVFEPSGWNAPAGRMILRSTGNLEVSGSVTAAGGFQFSGGPRVPRIFVQSGTPSGASDGDLWIW